MTRSPRTPVLRGRLGAIGLFAVAVAAFLAASGCPSARGTAGGARDGLGRKAPVEAEILRAEDRRELLAGLLDAAKAEDAATRARAARALGRIGGPDAYEPLAGLLDDPSPDVRAAAAFAYGRTSEDAVAGIVPEPMEAIRLAASDPEPVVRIAAADAIALGEPRPLGAALASLLGDASREVVQRACLAVPSLPDPASQLDAVRPALQSDDPVDRRFAAYAVARIAAPSAARPEISSSTGPRAEARDALVSVLDHETDPWVLHQIARGLRAPEGPDEFVAVAKLLRSQSPTVRATAVLAFKFSGAPMPPIREILRNEQVGEVRKAALEVLGAMGGEAAFGEATAAIKNEPKTWLVAAGVKTLFRASPFSARSYASALTADPRPEIRRAVAAALAGDPFPVARSSLLGLIEDPDLGVRTAATRSLARRGEPLDALFGDAITGDTPASRTALATALRWRGRPGRVSAPLYDEAWDRAATLWMAAVEAEDALTLATLVEAAASAPDDPRAAAVLRAAAESPLAAPRAAVHALAPEAAGSAPRGATTPTPDDYVAVARWASKPRAAVVQIRRPGFRPGRFVIRLATDTAPLAARRFAELAESGHFDGVAVDRLVPGFIWQTGDRRGDTLGGFEEPLRDELDGAPFEAGDVAFATLGPDRVGTQWFVALSPQPHLRADHTRIGRIVQNFSGVARRIEPGDVVEAITVYEGDGTEPLEPL